jgi:hypothetical protein
LEDAQANAKIMMDDIKAPGIRHTFVKGGWFLGRQFQEQVPTLRKLVYIEEPISKAKFRGTTAFASPIGGYTLILKQFAEGGLSGSIYSGAVAYQHRNFDDALRLNINVAGVMNSFFELALTGPLMVDVAPVGSAIYAFLIDSDPSQPHWANGKWVVMAAEHFGHEGQFYSKLLLAKPSIATESLPKALDASLYLKD